MLIISILQTHYAGILRLLTPNFDECSIFRLAGKRLYAHYSTLLTVRPAERANYTCLLLFVRDRYVYKIHLSIIHIYCAHKTDFSLA